MKNNELLKLKINHSKNDEFFTPEYAIQPILKYLKPNSKIWCPFDNKDSNFVKILKENGHDVVYTHIDHGDNFLKYKKGNYGLLHSIEAKNIDILRADYIISNPPLLN